MIAEDITMAQAKAIFRRVRMAEHSYSRKLRGVAREIGRLIRELWVDDDADAPYRVRLALERYSKVLEPWAEAVGRKMAAEVAARDRTAWKRLSKSIGRHLESEIVNAPIGARMQEIVRNQVDLITSLPLHASERVQTLAIRATHEGTRPAELAREILRTEHVTAARATLIARTEIGRAATSLTQARSEYVGSTHFIWRTVGDSSVRKSHRRLNGKTFRWDQPPECDPGRHALPGAIFNCRCFPEPVIPD